MIAAKVFEVRDRGTFIPVLAVETADWNDSLSQQAWLMRRAAYLSQQAWLMRRAAYAHHILLTHLTSRRTEYDPGVWDNRTMKTAHQYIIENWSSLKGGEVIDVRFILNEVDKPCESERMIDG
jgi:hypothetical protein